MIPLVFEFICLEIYLNMSIKVVILAIKFKSCLMVVGEEKAL